MKKIKFLFLIFYMLYLNFSYAQTNDNTINSVYKKSFKLMQNDDYFTAIRLIDSVLSELKFKNSKDAEALFLKQKGLAYVQLQGFKTAEDCYLKSMQITDSLGLKKRYITTYTNLVHSYMLSNNIKKYEQHLTLLKNIITDEIDIFFVFETELIALEKQKKHKEILDKATIALKLLNGKKFNSKNIFFKKRFAILFTIYQTFSLMELNIELEKANSLLTKLKNTNFKKVLWYKESVFKHKANVFLYKYKYFNSINKNLDSAQFYHNHFIKSNKETFEYLDKKRIKNTFILKQILDKEKEFVKSKYLLKVQKEKNLNIRFIAILIISTLILFALFFYNLILIRTSKKIKKINKKISLLNSKLEKQNIELKNKNLRNKELIEINDRNIFAKTVQISTIRDKVKKIINNLTEKHSSINVSHLFSIEKSLESIITENEIWKDFKIQFTKTRPGFFKKLKIINSNLTVNDLKHCAYIVANLKAKEVADLLYLSPRSVETTRYRLNKKLNIPTNVKLHNFLNELE